MSVIRNLQEQLEQVQTAQFVTTMLRDISATRLQSIRQLFDTNKVYYQQLHGLMEGVKRYAAAKHIVMESTAPDRGRIFVAVTANNRFYGNLNVAVMNTMSQVLDEQSLVSGFVIGQTGQQYIDAHPNLSGRVQCSVFAQDEPTSLELQTFIKQLSDYNEVIIIHPTFINSFRQEVKLTDITHQPVDSTEMLVPSLEYLCEPELVEILQFFRTHIRLTLFLRVLLETRLALTGARLMKMQRARERSVELVKEQRQVIHKEVRTISSMRLLETSVSFHKESSL